MPNAVSVLVVTTSVGFDVLPRLAATKNSLKFSPTGSTWKRRYNGRLFHDPRHVRNRNLICA